MRQIKNQAFTLIELLVVMAIIGAIIGLLLAAVQKVRESSSRVRCQNNMHEIALAFHSYHDVHGTFAQHDLSGGWSSLVKILPYCEQENFYNQLDVAHTSPLTNPLAMTPVPLFGCPSNVAVAKTTVADDDVSTAAPTTMISWTADLVGTGTSFSDAPGPHAIKTCSGNSAPAGGGGPGPGPFPFAPMSLGAGQFGNGVNPHRNNVTISFSSILDGSSNTFLLGETEGMNSLHSGSTVGTAFYGINAAGEDSAFRSNHTRGANFAMCDGSVHFLRDSIDQTIFRGLASIAGGEGVAIPD